MKTVLQNLFEIARKESINEIEMDYFEDHVEDFPDQWGNLYLWSVQNRNYQVSDYVLECGLDLNKSKDVKHDLMGAYSMYRLYTDKIIQDGFEIIPDIYNYIINTYSNDEHFSKDRLDSDYKNSLYLNRQKKILKLKNNFHQQRSSIAI